MADELIDSSGNGHAGTEVGAAGTYSSPSVFGAAFGSSRNQTLTTQGVSFGILPTPSTFTVAGWYRPNAMGSTRHILGVDDGGGTNSAMNVRHLSSNQLSFGIRFNSGAGFLDIGDPTPLVINTPYHIEASWDGSTLRLFKDGVLVVSGSIGSMRTWAIPFRIGNHGGGVGGPICDLDDFILTTSVLHTSNFTPPTAPYTPDANTVGLWRFDKRAIGGMMAVFG